MTSFADGLSDIDAATAEGEDEGEVDNDFLEISMIGCDGLRCQCDPLRVQCFTPEHDISSSLVALERSIKSCPEQPASSSKALDPTQKPNDRTMQVAGDVKALKSIRTPHHQGIYPSKATLPGPFQIELSEMKAVR